MEGGRVEQLLMLAKLSLGVGGSLRVSGLLLNKNYSPQVTQPRKGRLSSGLLKDHLRIDDLNNLHGVRHS